MKRRVWLSIGAAVVGAGALGYVNRNGITRAVLTSRENEGVDLTAQTDMPTCMLTPEQVEGPFFSPAPDRRDITEDREGAALSLELSVVDAATCRPVSGAVVEVWHCDAAGRYSGYPEELARKPFDTLTVLGAPDGHVERTNEKTYLRGAQRVNAAGWTMFETIVPGWYEPRIPHVHVKVFANGKSYLTTQLYFPQPLVDELYGEHPAYAAHSLSPYHVGNDLVLGENPDARGLLLRPVWTNRWRASARLAIVS